MNKNRKRLIKELEAKIEVLRKAMVDESIGPRATVEEARERYTDILSQLVKP